MIRKLPLLLSIVMLGSLVPAPEQDASKFDLFGGYSYLNASGNDQPLQLEWLERAGYLQFYSVVGSDSRFWRLLWSPFKLSANDYGFVFGPTIHVRSPQSAPFVHSLFGVDRFHATALGGTVNNSAFAMPVGGGVDIPVNGTFSIRAAQIDWLCADHFNNSQNNLRVLTGVVFRFGEWWTL